jgi:hypothetical protein
MIRISRAAMTGGGHQMAAAMAETETKEERMKRMVQAQLARDEACLLQFMKDHPDLTREQALKLLEAEGF